MLRKMMLALALCGLTAGALAQGGKMDTKETGKGKMETKAGQARDAKGRFVKKDKTDSKTPTRDAKGRFVKKGTADVKTKTKRTLPPRDPKTGRFMKKEDAAKMSGKMTDKKSSGKMDDKKK